MKIQINKEYGDIRELNYSIDPGRNYHSVKSIPSRRTERFRQDPVYRSMPEPSQLSNEEKSDPLQRDHLCSSFRDPVTFGIPYSEDLVVTNRQVVNRDFSISLTKKKEEFAEK